ncbi:hypothetical protein IVA94_36825 [Bradyrhizobium sp. 156]|uniref:hypothetical protein n=1 Tax=Bradyrhizobium sp. 156 TaxID=2782630 RepID=UPI001FF929C4|nr:hypothetical protein [Bradyrhizobium sp. 156]MCK1326333.1 hypothetical protein [Bradyrhizobium sp. 156]
MSQAIKSIVSGYVKVRNSRALTELLTHRRRMLSELQAVSGINAGNSIDLVQSDIEVIEAGLEELKPPPGSLPENEWR